MQECLFYLNEFPTYYSKMDCTLGLLQYQNFPGWVGSGLYKAICQSQILVLDETADRSDLKLCTMLYYH
jgi:hypothetical protein